MRALRAAPATGFGVALAAQIAWAEATLRRELPPRQRLEVRSALWYWREWQRRLERHSEDEDERLVD